MDLRCFHKEARRSGRPGQALIREGEVEGRAPQGLGRAGTLVQKHKHQHNRASNKKLTGGNGSQKQAKRLQIDDGRRPMKSEVAFVAIRG